VLMGGGSQAVLQMDPRTAEASEAESATENKPGV
jgi:hypothetical protein